MLTVFDQFFNQAHTRMGTIVVSLLGIQPILGWVHHRHFLKHRRRGAVSYVHIWYGRILLVLAVINGGLGIQLAKGSTGLLVAYCAIAGVATAVYVATVAWTTLKKRKRTDSKGSEG